MDLRSLLGTDLFKHSVADYARASGPDLLARTEGFHRWQESRSRAGTWPYSRSLAGAPRAECGVRAETGARVDGLNFASQDYLSLSSHPAVLEAAHRALDEHGPHSAGSAMLTGNTAPGLRLEEELADLLRVPHVALFSTGWGAGFGTIVGLVRRDDHVLLDDLSHACLQQGAAAATPNVRRFRHLDNDGVRARLRKIRAQDATNAILVVTEGLFSMDSDVPAIEELQDVCREHGATLLVDVAHDLGAMGPGGTGFLGAQEMLGKVDLVVGAFSKTFASNGGFLATGSAAVRQYVKVFGGTHIFSNAISPVQCATVSAALGVVRSAEGDERRARLMDAAMALRDGFAARGMECLGVPSAVVPVPIGEVAVARVAAKLAFERGVFANLVEYPAVGLKSSRFRMQVMSDHTPAHAAEAARVVAGAVADAREMLAPDPGLEVAAA